jgi:hypothetical protein
MSFSSRVAQFNYVKLKLFRAYWVCFFCTVAAMNVLKVPLSYDKHHSITMMFPQLEQGLPAVRGPFSIVLSSILNGNCSVAQICQSSHSISF